MNLMLATAATVIAVMAHRKPLASDARLVERALARVDGACGGTRYFNAGHNPPVLMRRDGSHELLRTGGTILGILPHSRCERGEAQLASGDRLAIYTDDGTATPPARPSRGPWPRAGRSWRVVVKRPGPAGVSALHRIDGEPRAKLA